MTRVKASKLVPCPHCGQQTHLRVSAIGVGDGIRVGAKIATCDRCHKPIPITYRMDIDITVDREPIPVLDQGEEK